MAITWGAWEYSGGNGMRCGLEWTIGSVSTGSSSVSITVKLWTQNQYSYSDDQVLDVSGDFGSNVSYNNNDGGAAVLRDTKVLTHNYSSTSYGSSPGSWTFGFTVTGAFNGVTPSISRSATIPARPYAAPLAHNSITASRSSDTTDAISWSRNIPGSGQRPYQSQTLQARVYTGSAWGAWGYDKSLSGSATSYNWTGLSSNRAYQFRIRANNSAGSSAWTTSDVIYHTPAAPSSAKAKLNSAGTAITVTWVNNAYVSGLVTNRVERSINGGAFASVATGISGTATSWTDNSPTAGATHAYRVRTFLSTGSLFSAYSTTSTLATAAAPLAPTLLTLDKPIHDINTESVTFGWQHNDGGDGSTQSGYNLQVSVDGGATWLQLIGASGDNSTANPTTIAMASWWATNAGAADINNTEALWRVRTRGIVSAGWSPYSAAAPLRVAAAPVVTPTALPDPTLALPIQLEWSFSQYDGGTQATDADIWLNDSVSGLNLARFDLSDSVYDPDTGLYTTILDYPVEDGTTYRAWLNARDDLGAWVGLVDCGTTTIDLLPPAPVLLVAAYDEGSGSMEITLTAQTPSVGTESAVATVTLEGRYNPSEGDLGGWYVVASDVELTELVPTVVLDLVPAINGTNEYRLIVTAVSSASETTAPVEVITTEPDWCFLSAGDAFEQVLRFWANPTMSTNVGRAKALHQFAGRKKPVEFSGASVRRVVSITGLIEADASTQEQWEDLAQTAATVLWRDPSGRRIFGSVSDVSFSRSRDDQARMSFSVTEVDYAG